MLRLREPACPTVSAETGLCAAILACAGVAAVIFSAICAIMLPRPAINAAKIIRLRIYGTLDETCDNTTSTANPRLPAALERRHFDEKDERSVNAAASAELRAAICSIAV